MVKAWVEPSQGWVSLFPAISAMQNHAPLARWQLWQEVLDSSFGSLPYLASRAMASAPVLNSKIPEAVRRQPVGGHR